MDYYILFIWGLVEPELVGPFDNPEDRDKEAQKLYRENREQSGYFKMTVPKGIKIEIDSYSNDDLQGD